MEWIAYIVFCLACIPLILNSKSDGLGMLLILITFPVNLWVWLVHDLLTDGSSKRAEHRAKVNRDVAEALREPTHLNPQTPKGE